ncbi:hypothetical protein MLD38_017433 [Melastoma candidum]|uniref:Uncharacterized protein n=1 Tax=Melastoma candidum TaxID=119954 RepID=A0ACB9QRR9_9MYRT|nr:hypothetical protein MLD38_017433 [Melastoma candidum]
MKRAESRKSHSWWRDSHIGPRNSKWIADNLEDMDQTVKRMMKLMDEDGDSFAKKVDMYYKRRPDLISHIEEFYRMYRSLAERYDHLAGELRRNVPFDLHSQSSGISDSTSDMLPKEGYESSSLTDSEPECDSSSVNNYSGYLSSGTERGLQEKVLHLENELRLAKGKLRSEILDNADVSFREPIDDSLEDAKLTLANYERELAAATERTHLLKGKIVTLNTHLQKSGSDAFLHASDDGGGLTQAEVYHRDIQLELTQGEVSPLQDNLETDDRSDYLAEQLKALKEKLQGLETENHGLRTELQHIKSAAKHQLLVQEQVESAQKDAGVWKTKYNAERKEISKLQERMARLKTSLSDRDREVRELKIAVSDAEQKIFPEKHQIKAEMSKILEERTLMEEQLREQESRGRLLEEEIRQMNCQIADTEDRFNRLVSQLRTEIAERAEEHENLKNIYNLLLSERNALHTQVSQLEAENLSKSEQINEREKQLEQMWLELVERAIASEALQELVQELRARARQLEEDLDRHGLIILEGAENKREAIRQLCFSLEHYRNHYHSLQQAFLRYKRHKRAP